MLQDVAWLALQSTAPWSFSVLHFTMDTLQYNSVGKGILAESEDEDKKEVILPRARKDRQFK